MIMRYWLVGAVLSMSSGIIAALGTPFVEKGVPANKEAKRTEGSSEHLSAVLEHQSVVADLEGEESRKVLGRWSKATPGIDSDEVLRRYVEMIVQLFLPFIHDRIRATNEQIGEYD
eukprot:GHVU01095565.1.p1 GENE.GHVU01095565.1~~GHVU01095565.1.p1  ORF type:complete len:116 (-),score=13.33 GHVU01095565.1:545-892(-)